MNMGIHESGHREHSTAIEYLLRLHCPSRIDSDNLAVLNHHRARINRLGVDVDNLEVDHMHVGICFAGCRLDFINKGLQLFIQR